MLLSKTFVWLLPLLPAFAGNNFIMACLPVIVLFLKEEMKFFTITFRCGRTIHSDR